MKKTILSLFRSSHLKFGVIAAALFALSLFVGLSAYLTTSTETPYNPTLQAVTDGDIGLDIDGKQYTSSSDAVYPGDTIELYPTVSNTGNIPIYVFAVIDFGGLESPVSEDSEGAIYRYRYIAPS